MRQIEYLNFFIGSTTLLCFNYFKLNCINNIFAWKICDLLIISYLFHTGISVHSVTQPVRMHIQDVIVPKILTKCALSKAINLLLSKIFSEKKNIYYCFICLVNIL